MGTTHFADAADVRDWPADTSWPHLYLHPSQAAHSQFGDFIKNARGVCEQQSAALWQVPDEWLHVTVARLRHHDGDRVELVRQWRKALVSVPPVEVMFCPPVPGRSAAVSRAHDPRGTFARLRNASHNIDYPMWNELDEYDPPHMTLAYYRQGGASAEDLGSGFWRQPTGCAVVMFDAVIAVDVQFDHNTSAFSWDVLETFHLARQ